MSITDIHVEFYPNAANAKVYIKSIYSIQNILTLYLHVTASAGLSMPSIPVSILINMLVDIINLHPSLLPLCTK